MADGSEHKSAAQLQREIEAQRSRVESTIDQIQERLSPGQLVDELLTYTRSGGGQFLSSAGSNFARTASANPIPIALLGISLVWLMAKPGGNESRSSRRHTEDRYDGDRDWDRRLRSEGGSAYPASSYTGSSYAGTSGAVDSSYAYDRSYAEDYDDTDYPIAPVKGNVMQRLGSVTDDSGRRYSEFVDDAGRKFRAVTDQAGNRAGHFIDEAGNTFKGFTDEAGNRITQFRDEAGNLLQEATGWASHTWRQIRRTLHDARDMVGHGARGVRSGASGLGGGLRQGAGSIQHLSSRAGGSAARGAVQMFQQQPLIGGALAFAAGAAVAATLPHTEQEDRLLGETADHVREEATARAAELYQQGKGQVGELYEKGREQVGSLYGTAAERAGTVYQSALGAIQETKNSATSGLQNTGSQSGSSFQDVSGSSTSSQSSSGGTTPPPVI